jgi:hypothetical protein
MRRTASEVLRSLEMRVAHLERQANSNRVSSDWKSNSVFIYEQGRNTERHWIATTYPQEVKSVLRGAKQDVVSTEFIEHPMYEDMDITIFELDSSNPSRSFTFTFPIKHELKGNPKDRGTLMEIKALLLV